MEVIHDTYRDTKIGRIPKDWNVVKLAELGQFLRGHTYSAKNVVSEGLLVLRSTNIQNNHLVLDKDLVFVNNDCRNEILLKNKDLVICMANGSKRLVGKSAQYNGEDRTDITVGAFCSIFRSDNPLVPFLFNSELYRKYLQIVLAGSTINNLKSSELEKLSFPIPSNDREQQKIAEILSTVDKQISATENIINKSKELKKGLMQKLFSEGIGQTEFKDTKIGRIPVDWKLMSLDELKAPNTTITYGVVKPGPIDDLGVLFVRGGDVKNGKISNELRTISKEVSAKYKRTLLEGGELLVSLVGYPGECAIVPDYLNGANIARQVGYIKLSEHCIKHFIQQYLSSEKGKKNLLGNMVGSAQQVINLNMLRKVNIPLPPLPEQQKIAEILSEADKKIEKEEQHRSELEQLKKGLMQQLLTGQKRVKV